MSRGSTSLFSRHSWRSTNRTFHSSDEVLFPHSKMSQFWTRFVSLIGLIFRFFRKWTTCCFPSATAGKSTCSEEPPTRVIAAASERTGWPFWRGKHAVDASWTSPRWRRWFARSTEKWKSCHLNSRPLNTKSTRWETQTSWSPFMVRHLWTLCSCSLEAPWLSLFTRWCGRPSTSYCRCSHHYAMWTSETLQGLMSVPQWIGIHIWIPISTLICLYCIVLYWAWFGVVCEVYSIKRLLGGGSIKVYTSVQTYIPAAIVTFGIIWMTKVANDSLLHWWILFIWYPFSLPY